MSTESQQVSFWSVHEYVSPTLEAAGSWPLVGSVEWAALPENDPAKLAALLDAARHHALRIEIAQAALAEASRDISAAADWKAIGRRIFQRRTSAAYIPRARAS